MTDDNPQRPASSPLDDHSLDGHTVAELSDYLDRGRHPRDPTIESSPAAQNALAALSRLKSVAPRVLDADAAHFEPKHENWISRILDQIGVQAHAGRDIPIAHDVVGATLSISEGAVRALVREAGDETDGILVERTRLNGDIETPGSEVEVHVVVSTFEEVDVASVISEFERRVRDAVGTHTELSLNRVVVRVHDTDLTAENGDGE